MFQISQIGDHLDSRGFLEHLRDDYELRDLLYCTSGKFYLRY
jgi:hypothetical protein